VYSYQAYLELNKGARNYHDLLTDEPFNPKSSVIVLNDPAQPSLFKRSHVFEDGADESIAQSGTAKRIMQQFIEVEDKGLAS